MIEKTENFEELVGGQVTHNRKRLLGFGILSLILGVIGTGMSVSMTLTSILIIGIFVIVTGIIFFIEAFSAPDWSGKLYYLLLSILYVITGIIMVVYPAASAVWFTLFLVIFFSVAGIMRIIAGFLSRDELSGWGWMVFGGLLNIILAVMIYAQWPESGLWVIGLFVSIELIVQGINAIVLSRVIKQAQSELK